MAQQQSNSNIQTAAANSYLNAINQYTPYGNVKWKEVGQRQMGDGTVKIPQWEVYTELTPEQQKIVDAEQAAKLGTTELARSYIDRIRDATKTPFTLAGLPEVGPAPNWNYDENARVAARDRIIARNQTTLDRDRTGLETKLRNQGLVPGTEAWSAAYDDLNRSVNDFRLGADIQAGGDALREAQAGFDANSRIFGMRGDLRTRALQERLAERSVPINEVAALLGTGPGVQLPTFQNTQQVPIAPTDTMTPQMMAHQARMQEWQQGQQANNALMGSIFGLAGAGLGGWLGGPMGASIGSSIGRRAAGSGSQW